MPLLFSYSLSRPLSISSAAEMCHRCGTGETHDVLHPCSLERCPQTHSRRHSNRFKAVRQTTLTSPSLWHSPTIHLFPLHQLFTMMEAVGPRHGRSMTGQSHSHNLSVMLFSIDNP